MTWFLIGSEKINLSDKNFMRRKLGIVFKELLCSYSE